MLDDGRRPRDRLGALVFLIGTMVRSVVVGRTVHRSMWRECFVTEFGSQRFETWQPEYLQLFSFVALAALDIDEAARRRRSATRRSRRVFAGSRSARRPCPVRPRRLARSWKLPGTPLEVNDEQLATSGTTAGRSTPMSPPLSPAAMGAHE